MSSLYVLTISPLSDVELIKIFLQSVGCCFVLLTVSFSLQKLFNFIRSHLSILDLKTLFISVCSGNFPCAHVFEALPTISSIRLSVSSFMSMSLIYLQLSFVQEVKNGSICISLHVDSQLNQLHFLKMLSFFHWMGLAPLSKIK